jgi:stage II sporulation protein R
MKNGILQFAATLLAVTFMVAVFPTEEDYRVYEDTLRLHILANSDSRVDQDLKIGVRDLILDKLGGEFEGEEATSSALEITAEMLGEIKDMADEFLKESGADYSAAVTLAKEWYETRDYKGFTLPRGYYSSLIISLGEGEGQNWWCILFPPMCTDLASEGGGENEGTIQQIGRDKYSIKFKTMEILADLFKKKG